MPTITILSHEPAPPRWLSAFFEDVDAKRFGDGFAAPFLPDTELLFGTHRLVGFAAIKAHLQDLDSRMDTHHEVHEFWGSNTLNIFRGTIRFRPIGGGEEKTSQIVHVLHMDDGRPGKVRCWHGAAGPGI